MGIVPLWFMAEERLFLIEWTLLLCLVIDFLLWHWRKPVGGGGWGHYQENIYKLPMVCSRDKGNVYTVCEYGWMDLLISLSFHLLRDVLHCTSAGLLRNKMLYLKYIYRGLSVYLSVFLVKQDHPVWCLSICLSNSIYLSIRPSEYLEKQDNPTGCISLSLTGETGSSKCLSVSIYLSVCL